jgi:hypothetical protein
MIQLKNSRIINALKHPKAILTFLLLTLFTIPTIASAADHPCKNASKQLRGDLNVTMNRGGLWALMEQTEGLQDKSVAGLQADGKLARAVGIFENLCSESEKKPTKQLFDNIEKLLGEARTIWNPRSSGEEIVKLIINLNKKTDSLLKLIE